MLRFSSALFLLLLLSACGELGVGTSSNGPTIVEFGASPPSISAGESSTLVWRAPEATSYTLEPGIGSVTASSVTVSPLQTTTYTLTAINDQGRTTAKVKVTVGGSENDATAPSGDFGVSRVATGPFTNDRPGGISSAQDERVVRVAPGGTFYAQVDYSDPSGVRAVELNLVNSSPAEVAGTLEPNQQFFTKGEPLGSCDLSGSATRVTCIYPIRVDEAARNISELDLSGSEFAYVFRTKVTDSAGNQSDEAKRGYVVIDENASSPEPTDPNPTNPNPINDGPADTPSEETEASVSIERAKTLTLRKKKVSHELKASVTGFDADKTVYRWRVVDGDADEVRFDDFRAEDTKVTFREEGEYRLELRVSDGTRQASATVDIMVRERD